MQGDPLLACWMPKDLQKQFLTLNAIELCRPALMRAENYILSRDKQTPGTHECRELRRAYIIFYTQ